MQHRITRVTPEGPAGRAGLRAGDVLHAIDGVRIRDEIDFQYFSAAPNPTVEVLRDGAPLRVRVPKRDTEPFGIAFDAPLQTTRMCANHCRFCFVDQLPEGVRSSLCQKDDDWRLSLMMGNYVTLTNVFDRELARIIERRASPLYISVHATDPDVRLYLCGHRPPDRLMDQLRALRDAGLAFHSQIVLCPGINDGDVLERSLSDLYALGDAARSVALVPVGLTAHRAGLDPLRPYTPKGARALIERTLPWQARALRERDTRWVFPADEFYSLSGTALPPYEAYEAFEQIENGVGLLALLREEMREAAEERRAPANAARHVVIATGTSAAPYLRAWIGEAGLLSAADVVAIENRFFGSSVTVAGLVTGGDIAEQLGAVRADAVLIPACMLRAGEDVFLDGMTVAALEARLGCRVRAVDVQGEALLEAIAG